MTNQGDLVNKIMRSGNAHEKEYIVTVDRPVTEHFLEQMAGGHPAFKDLDQVTRPCKVKKVENGIHFPYHSHPGPEPADTADVRSSAAVRCKPSGAGAHHEHTAGQPEERELTARLTKEEYEGAYRASEGFLQSVPIRRAENRGSGEQNGRQDSENEGTGCPSCGKRERLIIRKAGRS